MSKFDPNQIISLQISYLCEATVANSSIYNNSIKHKSTKLNGSKYCYVSQTIQLNISHLFTQS